MFVWLCVCVCDGTLLWQVCGKIYMFFRSPFCLLLSFEHIAPLSKPNNDQYKISPNYVAMTSLQRRAATNDHRHHYWSICQLLLWILVSPDLRSFVLLSSQQFRSQSLYLQSQITKKLQVWSSELFTTNFPLITQQISSLWQHSSDVRSVIWQSIQQYYQHKQPE